MLHILNNVVSLHIVSLLIKKTMEILVLKGMILVILMVIAGAFFFSFFLEE
jgi:hypothetical protein